MGELIERIAIPAEIAGYDGAFVDRRVVFGPGEIGFFRSILLGSDALRQRDPEWLAPYILTAQVFTCFAARGLPLEPYGPHTGEALRDLAKSNPALWAWLFKTAQEGIRNATVDLREPVIRLR